jgi:hypothetical protein
VLALAILWATAAPQQPLLPQQTAEAQQRKSEGCTSSGCHAGIEPMHESKAVKLGCTDCHGGRADTTVLAEAHVLPKYPSQWPSSGNPERTYTLLNYEKPEFIRFINPGDFRAVPQTCGTAGCHEEIAFKAERSMMTHGAFLWGAALYNNGAWPRKDPEFGESYAPDGTPQLLRTIPEPSAEETRLKGILPMIGPLPRFEFTEPGNTLHGSMCSSIARTESRNRSTVFRPCLNSYSIIRCACVETLSTIRRLVFEK